jgi:hypothetical protein
MTKKKMLDRIKEIISEIGYVNAGEMQLDRDPLYGTLGPNITALVEGIGSDNFKVVVYNNDIEIDTLVVDYGKIEDVMDEFEIEYMLESLEEYQKTL